MAADARPSTLAVVGGGWAGLAAAVRATQAGRRVTLFEMAPQPGGRARAVGAAGAADGALRPAGAADRDGAHSAALDNGQHILIGAYRRTLDLMQTVGADVDGSLARRPLELRYPDGRGLRLPPGPPWLAFVRAIWAADGWSARDRLALLAAASRWSLAGFRCPADWTVDRLCTGLPPTVRQLLIDPLCVAALNTPARCASAAVLLRVLRDALFSGRGSADLLLPRSNLSTLLPAPAARWLRNAGAALRLGTRVHKLAPDGRGWQVDGECFDAVILACSAHEAARLAAAHAPAWVRRAQALRYEPIVTVYLQATGARLPAPMTALLDSPTEPAQFAFDHGALGGAAGRIAFVISGAQRWVDAGADATVDAVLRQAQLAFPDGTWPRPPALLRAITEKRATFRCTPLLDRPPAVIAPGLLAAGDYVAGPYPATLEGAVRSGEAAAAQTAARGRRTANGADR